MTETVFNQRPIDPAWVRRADELTERAAAELRCTVLLVAIQEGGKTAFCVAGEEFAGPEVKEYLKGKRESMPMFLLTLARMCALNESLEQRAAKGKTKQ